MKKSAILFLATLPLFAGLVFGGTVTSALDKSAETGFKDGINDVGGGGGSSVTSTIQNIINILLYVAGIAAVVIIVIGGVRFVTSEGDSQKTAKARDIIVNAAIGLVLAVIAYAIVNFVLGQFS